MTDDTTSTKKHHGVLKNVKPAIKDAATVLPFVPAKAHEYTWEELQHLEKRRRQVLTHVEDGFWEILGHWDGTCFRMLITDPLMWICNILYIVVRIHARFGQMPDYVATLGSVEDITIVGGFLSFFLVMYVRQNHNRYFGLYADAMSCKGRIFDVASLAKVYIPEKKVASRLVRYMNAAYIAGYTGLTPVYERDNFFINLNSKLGLLTENELERMDDMDLDKGGSCNRELIVWCLHEVQQLHAAGELDNELAQQFRHHILRLRACIGRLYNAADLPIPFFYVHFICLLTVLYLPIFAISVAYKAGTGDDVHWTADLVGAALVVFQSFFVIGLRVLGTKMNDPFGADLIDLSVIFFCVFNWRMSNRVLEARLPIPDADDEHKLKQQRSDSIGRAWEETEDGVVTTC